eukprot:767603-Hanusia_phi.AAC.7
MAPLSATRVRERLAMLPLLVPITTVLSPPDTHVLPSSNVPLARQRGDAFPASDKTNPSRQRTCTRSGKKTSPAGSTKPYRGGAKTPQLTGEQRAARRWEKLARGRLMGVPET